MDFELDITQIRTFVTRNYEPIGMYIVDMIYIADEPHVVFEWRQREDGQHVPVVFVPIEAQFLEPVSTSDEYTFQYRLSVEDPRQMS
jgi:hypothetical protein